MDRSGIQEFRRLFDQYAHYLPQRWADVREFRGEYRAMPATLQLFRDLLKTDGTLQVMDLTRGLSRAWTPSVPRWARSARLRIAKGKASFLRRLSLRAMLW